MLHELSRSAATHDGPLPPAEQHDSTRRCEMRKKTLALLGLLLACPAAWADDGPGLPRDATFSTLALTTLAIEGLTGDDRGNLYTTGRNPPVGQNCPVWRFAAHRTNPPAVTVGFVPGPCSP